MAPKATVKESSPCKQIRPISRVSDLRPPSSSNVRPRYGHFPIKRVAKSKQVYPKGQKKKRTKNYVVQVSPRLARLRSLRDLKIPSMAMSGPGADVLKMAGKAAIFAAVAVDTLRVSSAIYTDLREKGKPGKLTVKTGASVGSGWLGSLGGAWGGHAAGAWIGLSIGSMFGGFGAVPGAAIGAMVGVFAGGMMGGLLGSKVTETVVDKYVQDSDQEDNDDEEEEESFVDFMEADKEKMLKVNCD